MRRPVRAGVTAATLVCTVILGTGVASASGGWVIQSTYAPPPAEANQKDVGLDKVSCSAANACVTIGHAGSRQFLSESWNGTKWSALLTPLPPQGGALSGVSCPAGPACIAVGFTTNSSLQSVPLVERWNGTTWQQLAASGPTGAGFGAVSCTSAQSCEAVGSYSTGPNNTTATLAEAWNGTSWTVQPTPSNGQHAGLFSVSCPTPSDCVAVGGNFISLSAGSTVFIERWNGTSWAVQKSPQVPRKYSPQLVSVSCATPSACTAIGNYFTGTETKVLVEHWNGTSWVRQHVPGAASNELFSVSCPSARSCTAIGGTVAGHWNGTAWTLQQTTRPPHVIGSQEMNDVSCPTASVCEAVGFFHAKRKTGRFRDRTLIEAS